MSRAVALTDLQAKFAELYVLDPEKAGRGGDCAVLAGYSADSASVTASRLLRHPNVRKEIERLTREALGDHAAAAVQLLGRVVRDERAPLKIRVDAAKAVLDRAGFVPPRAPEPVVFGDKPIAAMSIAELEAVARETREYLEHEGVLIDVTSVAVEAAPIVARSDSSTDYAR